MIRLILGARGPDDAPCGTLIVGLHTGERPPRGEAGMVDWRLSGAISRAILSGRVDGAAGTCVLMPAKKLPCSRVLLIGLGAPGEFKGRALSTAITAALSKLVGFKDADFAIALPGTKPWPMPKDAAEVIGESLLGTLARAAKEARITILGPKELKDELREWVRAAGDPVASHVVLEDGMPPMTTEQGVGP